MYRKTHQAYPGLEFVVANTLAKGKSWSQMKLTLTTYSQKVSTSFVIPTLF